MTGIAVPHVGIVVSGCCGKGALLPEHGEDINEDEVIFRNYQGVLFVYKQPRVAVAAP